MPLWIGTNQFYEELSRSEDYYTGDKWEFQRAIRDLKDCEAILEVGCGDGKFLQQLKCTRAVGLECNPLAIAQAREKGLNVLDVTLREFAQEHEQEFDGVCAFQVLEHVPEPIEFLRMLEKCLKPNGLMALAVPNAFGILRYIRPVPTDLPPHHLTRWATRCFKYFDNLGLQVVSLKCERLDGPRFHWILRWWDHVCGVVRDDRASWVENFRRHPVWLTGNLALHHGLGFLRRVGIRQLPVRGHSIYALLRNQS